MDNIVYTYGGGEALFKVLNGVQMIFKDGGIASNFTYLMTFVGLVWAAFQGIQQNSVVPKLTWFAKYILITSMFITPKTSLWVSDTVTGFKNKVDNLPIGLVLPASVFSSIGYSITATFDQAFSTVDNNIPYMKYGQSFGASLISQSRNFKIQDSAFRENMESFIDNCIIYDVMVGTKYSLSELRDSDNIWRLVSENASNIRRMSYRDGNNGKELISCREGVMKLNNYWLIDIEKLGTRFGNTIFGKYGQSLSKSMEDSNSNDLGKVFKKNVEVVLNLYSNHSTATNNLKQIMMINAFADIPMSYGAVRAKQQQQESWLISGQLAREILPTLHAVFAALIYASFSLIVGMLVLPSGFRAFGNYLGLLIWIETWPPLFAVLNLLTNISSRTYGGDFGNVTMNNISQIISHNNNISVVASGMMMLLPYLSYNILKGGAGQFVHFASQIMGASQSASSTASAEVISGNRSFDNVSLSNGQWFNNSGFKTDMNAMYRSGHREQQFSDGTIARETVNGNTILQSGAGLTHSVGAKSMHMSYSDSFQTREALSDEQSQMIQWQKEFDSLKSQSHSQSVDFVNRLARGESSGEHYNINHTTGSGKTLTSAITQAKELQDNYAFNHNQVSEKAIRGNIGFSKGGAGGSGGIGDLKPEGLLSKIGGGLLSGLSGGVDVSMSGRTDSANIQSLAENNSLSNRSDISAQSEDIARAAKDIQFSENQTEEKAMANSLVGTHQRMEELRDKISVSQDKIKRYQESLEHSRSSSFAINDDMYHRELNEISNSKDRYGFRIGEKRAAEIIDENGVEYQAHHTAFVAKYIPSQRMNMSRPNFDKEYEYAKSEYIPNNQNMTQYHEEVTLKGQDQLSSQSLDKQAKYEYESKMDSNKNSIEERESKILSKGEEAQQAVNKQQQDRGWYSKRLGRNKKEDNNFVGN